jgi:hypothetical protein
MLLPMVTSESSRDTVLLCLQPHLPKLEQCFRSAWTRWNAWLAKIDGSPADIAPRSRANVLYDFVTAEAIKAFLGADGIRVRRERGFLVLRFQDRVALRFKKFRNRKLGVSRNNTRQTALFGNQMLEFPAGSPKPMVHVTAGYLLDKLALDISLLAITCTTDGKHLWAPIELLPQPRGTVTSLPQSQPTIAPPSVSSTRMRNRKDERKGQSDPS